MHKAGSFRLAGSGAASGIVELRERNWRIIVIIPPVFSDPSSDTTAGGKLSPHQEREPARQAALVEGRMHFRARDYPPA